jgi:hypothetical protein
VIALKGNQAVIVLYGDIGTPDVTQVESFARLAIAKVP